MMEAKIPKQQETYKWIDYEYFAPAQRPTTN